jgi:hypothetical protein
VLGLGLELEPLKVVLAEPLLVGLEVLLLLQLMLWLVLVLAQVLLVLQI